MLFGYKVFIEVLKLKLRSLGWVLIQQTAVLIDRENLDTDTGTACEDGGSNQGDASTS